MASGVRLEKGKFSKTLLMNLDDYYKKLWVNPEYVAVTWHEWVDYPDVVVYRATKDGKTMGWIVYNPTTSTIQEVIMDRGWKGKKAHVQMVDALVARENLVSAEILKDDRDKYEWMLEYGFRPTRSFAREGFSLIKMDLSTSVLLKKAKMLKPSKKYRGKELVAIERIAKSQTEKEIKTGLEKLIEKLGGLEKFVKPGQSVVIKPNIVSDHGMKDGLWKGGIVTDIRVIKALVEILLPVAGKVIIAEGASINRSETTKMFAHYGYDRLVDIDPKKVSLVDLNDDDQVEKPVPGGKRMIFRKIPVTLEKADVIISVPVLKIHFAAIASLAIKHLQGAVPPLEKYMTHFFGLWQNLVNIHHLVKPSVTIIDGLVGQEDFGPVSGTPKAMNLLIGGTNPVAIDAVAMRIMGLDPATSPPVFLAYLQGFGPIEQNKIKVLGPSIEEIASPFKQPFIDLANGKDITIHGESACSGCRGYLHFVLAKLRRPDPADMSRPLMDRPFEKKVNIFLGPTPAKEVNPRETNIFMGICQQHNADTGHFLPGCPPHAEVIVNGIFGLFPDIEKPKYADESEEKKLGEMLQKILSMTSEHV
jgi:uncharacterized protein (DUF362 family)